MSRWDEIKYNFAFNILLPRFFSFVLLPYVILSIISASPDYVLAPTDSVKVVLASSLLLFGLSVTANLGVSRYLRLHQTQSSPYVYEAKYDPMRRSSYFRIQVADKAPFRQLVRDLRRDHPREAIRFWLLIDDLVFAPPMLIVLVMSLFMLLFTLVPWLVKLVWRLLKDQKQHPDMI